MLAGRNDNSDTQQLDTAAFMAEQGKDESVTPGIRVLSDARLLETILQQLPIPPLRRRETPHPLEPWQHGTPKIKCLPERAQRPLLTLFVLRRVCKTWLNAINASPALKRCMGLEMYVRTPDAPWYQERSYQWSSGKCHDMSSRKQAEQGGVQYAPFLWFLHLSGMPIQHRDGANIIAGHRLAKRNQRRYWQSFFAPGMKAALSDPHASWRKIMLSAHQDADPLQYHLVARDLRYLSRQSWTYSATKESTLGDFHDWYCSAVSDMEKTYQRKSEEYVKREEEEERERQALEQRQHAALCPREGSACAVCENEQPHSIAAQPFLTTHLPARAFGITEILEMILLRLTPTKQNKDIR
ncbi:Putative F-box domain-containing protein [Septoria linicola]|uniref:F-box domain-containing protein n=1 Tax=Septoria linicola TaxID=215465 RepID=A0A9Q9EII3_9PEZI|nr:putative F-box domain-containing protein [Septoria linicola]USW51077.1 Putative F-box domain-containing protein [Septoria linicola]